MPTSVSSQLPVAKNLSTTALSASDESSISVDDVEGAASIGHDKVHPFAQSAPVTVSEKAAVKFKPSLQVVNGCHPYPAVNTAGETSGGLKGTGDPDGKCKGSSLGSQVYGRAVWHKDIWAIMYAWYFPKDQGFWSIFDKGQRHKWVSAIMWLDNPALEKPTIIAVSTWDWAGGYDILKNNQPQECSRIGCIAHFIEYINVTTPMLSYEPYYNEPSYHTLNPTTARGTGEFQDLIMWEQLTDDAREALSEANFGDKSPVPFIDANFKSNLEMARPFL